MASSPLVFALFLLFQPCAQAAVSGGADWRLEQAAVGPSGASALRGGEYQLAQSLGEACLALQSLRGGQDSMLCGYLSQIPSYSTTSLTGGFTSDMGVAVSSDALIGVRSELPVRLSFTNEMSSASLREAISLTAVLDPMGNTISSTQAFTLAYSSATRISSLIVSGGWPKGTLFRFSISTAAKDINGVALAGAVGYSFWTLRDHQVENVAVDGSNPAARVRVPPLSFSGYFSLVVNADPQSAAILNANSKIAGSLGVGRKPVALLEANSYDASGQAWAGALGQNVTLSLAYQDQNSDGVVDGTSPGVRSKTLALWRLEEAEQLWVRQGASTLDSANRQVLLPTNHFSIYALIGALDTSVSDIYAFPVPFRPNHGDMARYGSWATGIRFTNLPSEGTIKIFSLSGELVRQLDISGSVQAWDVKDSSGRTVASGVYLWEAKSGANRKTGKLMVIK